MTSTVRLSFERLHYTVSIKGSSLPKALLKDIKAEVTSGHVLAILGPSGAGKTTLLNMLTLQQNGGNPSGYIRVNGEPLTQSLYDKACAYVEQFDTLWASLTVRDHLEYAMSLHRPELDAAGRAAEIDALIAEVGLEEFQDTRAGNEIIRGLSSGNKRRLSVALALVKRPSILFLDEPTTGVDSASAVRMMTFLKKVAAVSNVAVVCTIHQPPASVFAGFDNTLILSMGRVAYFGKAAKMGEYLASIGYPPTADTNPAEFILDLVNKDFTPAAGVRRVLDKWAERKDGEAYGCLEDDHLGVDGSPLGKADFSEHASIATQLKVLTDRSFVVAAREPLAYIVRVVANFSATLFFGIIYIKTREKVQEQIFPRTFFLMFCMGIPMQFILVSNFIYHYQWLSLKKEVKNGMYHPVASAMASWVVQLPMMFLLAATSLVPMFVLGDLAWISFPMALIFYAATFWSFEGMAQALACLPNVVLALFGFLNMYFTAFLFCGMFVDPEDVIWPIRAFCYFLPLGWSLQSYMYALHHDLPNHKGTVPCTPGAALPQGGVCTAQGFYCYSEADPTGAVCYGETGDEMLRSLSVQFTIFGDNGHYGRNLGLIVAFGVLMRVSYVGYIWVVTKMYGGQTPVEPSDSYAVMIETDESDSSLSEGEKKQSEAGAGVASPSALIESAMGKTPNGDSAVFTFSFKDLSYSIERKKDKEKGDLRVLHRVSASVSEGEVLAIVGPSGAGKTILLDTLTFSKGPGAPSGEIVFGGAKMTRADFVKSAIYVPRADNLWPTMTPRQHLDFAFKLYRPDLTDAAARESAVDELLAQTGLTSCQDTMAGGFLFTGLSGGQRRRLSLAVALVKQPRVIILDEPTSGLDSAAAAAIVSLLDSVARARRAAVLCTIHQPSALVFSGFHKVLVLSEGRVAYCGDRGGVGAYFESAGVPLSHDANPAEAVLDLVSKDATSAEDVNKILDSWDASALSKEVAAAAGESSASPPESAVSVGGGATATYHVFARQVRLALVDPLQYIGRLLCIPPIVSFFGLVYLASHEQNQKQVPFRLFYLWWVLALPACMGITTLIGTNRDTVSVVGEIRSGMYRVSSYVVSTSLVQIPALVVLSFAINVCSFGIGGWPWDNFVTFVFQYAINLWVFDSFGQLLAVLFANPIVGMLAYLGYWSTAIVFCGMVFRGEDVVWPFRSLYYLMPLKWLFNGVGYDIYSPATFKGAALCDPGSLIPGTNSTCTAAGFYCEGAASSFGCWGRTGKQVLRTLHMSYESIGVEDDRPLDVAVLFANVVLMKAAYVLVLWLKVSATDAPRAPAKVKK